MKTKFSTLDLFAVIHDLKSLEGLRVANIYDIDPKKYLIRLQVPNEKRCIMIASGMRIHVTNYDWPKAQFPSSFSMKLRKHVKQKRLTSAKQLGIDRIVDLQFGSGEMSCHVITELYDRGNIVLTDHNYNILNILRPRKEKDTDVKFTVGERYPVSAARQEAAHPTEEEIKLALQNSKENVSLKRSLAPLTQYGPSLIEHALLFAGISGTETVGKIVNNEESVAKVIEAMTVAKELFEEIRAKPSTGYLFAKLIERQNAESVINYEEFHPYKFTQYKELVVTEFETYSNCVDEYFSKIEEQRSIQSALSVERSAVKKFENIRKDQEERIKSLSALQEEKEKMGCLVELNVDLVDKAIGIVRALLGTKVSWASIGEMWTTSRLSGDEVAIAITKLDLEHNQIFLNLKNPYDDAEPARKVPIDLSLSAHGNSQKLFAKKKSAQEKEKKTISAAKKAIKSAQAQVDKTVDTVRIKSSVIKARKIMWFEKFFWFISSENYLIIGGRDFQQNELLVKRYLRKGDIYVHADVRGGSTVVIRNKTVDGEIPPKTLNEAGAMAVCYSSAWAAGITSAAWWVRDHQVSRTAPTGEYLPPGSFMIRGKKNFIPTCQLQVGFGIMFKLDEDSMRNHINERNSSNYTYSEDVYLEIEPNDVKIQGDSSDESESSENDIENNFPDVQINFMSFNFIGNEEYSIVQGGPPIVNKPGSNAVQNQSKPANTDNTVRKNRPRPLRMKHKKKKMQKYKDQEDDAFTSKTDLPSKKPDQDNAETSAPAHSNESDQTKPSSLINPKSKDEENKSVESSNIPHNEVVDEEDDEEDDTEAYSEEKQVLDSLTWKPKENDHLLYAIVIVAPYQMMYDFKYKVKLVPGTGKRGKVAKKALTFFQEDKSITPQELGLLRILSSDDQLSRNIPGKIRMQAPQIHRK